MRPHSAYFTVSGKRLPAAPGKPVRAGQACAAGIRIGVRSGRTGMSGRDRRPQGQRPSSLQGGIHGVSRRLVPVRPPQLMLSRSRMPQNAARRRPPSSLVEAPREARSTVPNSRTATTREPQSAVLAAPKRSDRKESELRHPPPGNSTSLPCTTRLQRKRAETGVSGNRPGESGDRVGPF